MSVAACLVKVAFLSLATQFRDRQIEVRLLSKVYSLLSAKARIGTCAAHDQNFSCDRIMKTTVFNPSWVVEIFISLFQMSVEALLFLLQGQLQVCKELLSSVNTNVVSLWKILPALTILSLSLKDIRFNNSRGNSFT